MARFPGGDCGRRRTVAGSGLTSPGAADRDHPARTSILEAAGLLCKLLLQDIERRTDGVALREGVSQDRIVSVHNPETRHGRKSSQQRFDGHKAALAVEAGSQLITAVAVLPGNVPDTQGALALVAKSERRLEGPVAETVADAACDRSMCRPNPGAGAASAYIPRRTCCRRPGPFRPARRSRPTGPCAKWPNTAGPVWCNWGLRQARYRGLPQDRSPAPAGGHRGQSHPPVGSHPGDAPSGVPRDLTTVPTPRHRVVRGPTRQEATPASPKPRHTGAQPVAARTIQGPRLPWTGFPIPPFRLDFWQGAYGSIGVNRSLA